MADTKISALTDGATIDTGDRIPVARSPYGSGDNRYVTRAYIAAYLVTLANTWTATQTITPAVNTSALVSSGGSLTGANAQSLVDLAATWNTSGTPTALKLNITDTASNAASLLMDLQRGGTSAFSVAKAGSLAFGDGTATVTLTSRAGSNSPVMTFQSNSVRVNPAAGVNKQVFGNTVLNVASDIAIGWASSTTAGVTNDTQFTRESAAFIGSTGSLRIMNATAIPANGTAGAGYKFSSTANFGMFFGSGAPTLVAAQGSLYLRSDGDAITRAYIATDSAGAWTALVSAG